MISGIGSMLLSRKAFSLIELLLVIVLMGVVAAVSVPNFSKTYGRMQLKQAAEDVQYLMNYGQSRAVIRSLPHRLVWDEEVRRCWLAEEKAEDDPASQEKSFQRIPGRWGREMVLPPGIQAVSSQAYFQFYPDGTIDKGTVLLCAKENCYTVSTQEKRGRVMMFEAAKAAGEEEKE